MLAEAKMLEYDLLSDVMKTIAEARYKIYCLAELNASIAEMLDAELRVAMSLAYMRSSQVRRAKKPEIDVRLAS